jgi:hypothetical protein
LAWRFAIRLGASFLGRGSRRAQGELELNACEVFFDFLQFLWHAHSLHLRMLDLFTLFPQHAPHKFEEFWSTLLLGDATEEEASRGLPFR